jgi:hypothetical protein
LETELNTAFEMMKHKIADAKGWRMWTRIGLGAFVGIILCFVAPYATVRLMSQSLYQRGPIEDYLYNDVY